MLEAESQIELGLAMTTPHPLNIEIERAEGVYLYTKSGKQIFDAISGIGVSNWGHKNQTITSRLHDQIDRNLHTMVYGEFIHESTVNAAKLLHSLLPPNLNATYFVNSGAEAIEGALKLAKRSTERSTVVACTGSYHGNTSGALSVSHNASRKAPFLPLLPEVKFIEFNSIEGLDLIDTDCACIIVETIQGDAGVRIPSRQWLQALRKKCDSTGTLLIFDEVQCGIGRTGKPFAFEHFDVVPDILCLGKALGGGMPIGAFTSSKELMSTLSYNPKLGHITTFGGNPLACAGALASLELLKKADFSKIEKHGSLWERKLANHNSVKEVRRIGLFFYVELENSGLVNETVMNGIDCGVLLFWFLSVPNAFRLSPPLNMTDEEASKGIERILKSLPH